MSTREEIREAQEASIADVERQLESGATHIVVEGRAISREAAWAATRSLRIAFSLGDEWRYDGQQVDDNGEWFVRVEHTETGEVELHFVGRFPG